MAIREILTIPDARLSTISEPVETIDDELLALLDDMLETMYDAPGIGLAAIQIGVPKRLVVIDTAKDDAPPRPHFLINPQITWTSEEMSTYEEGCLSIPDYFAEIERPSACRVTYLDRDGNEQEIEADGVLATCVQHEIDHLNGVLFIDHLSKLKRDRVIKKFAKAEKRKAVPA